MVLVWGAEAPEAGVPKGGWWSRVRPRASSVPAPPWRTGPVPAGLLTPTVPCRRPVPAVPYETLPLPHPEPCHPLLPFGSSLATLQAGPLHPRAPCSLPCCCIPCCCECGGAATAVGGPCGCLPYHLCGGGGGDRLPLALPAMPHMVGEGASPALAVQLHVPHAAPRWGWGRGGGTNGALCAEHWAPACRRCMDLHRGVTKCCHWRHTGREGPLGALAPMGRDLGRRVWTLAVETACMDMAGADAPAASPELAPDRNGDVRGHQWS